VAITRPQITCGSCEFSYYSAPSIICLTETRYHGGWLAPNIYYLGGSGCVRLNGIRIAGASGIFKGHDYNLGHYERIPYDNASLRSVYHVRSHDVFKLSLLTPGPEIFVSHDWPEGIYRYGDTAALLNRKPFFKPDIEKGELGNPHTMDILKLLRPSWWFSAHLHVRFQAEYDHTGQGVSDWGRAKLGRGTLSATKTLVEENNEIIGDEDRKNPESPSQTTRKADERFMNNDDEQSSVSKSGEPSTINTSKPGESSAIHQGQGLIGPDPPYEVYPAKPVLAPAQDNEGATTNTNRLPSTTKFLALDKCLPGRDFLEASTHCNFTMTTKSVHKIVDIPSPQDYSPPRLTFDIEWLAISKATYPLLSTERKAHVQPLSTLARRWVNRELEWVKDKITTIKRTTSPNSDTEEQGTEEEDFELKVEEIQQFVMTASGPSRNINPRHQREFNS